MTPPSHPDPAWKRLGDLLTQRRVDLDARYTRRRTFCDETGVDYRVVSDLERARRTNFSTPMIAQLEAAYQLTRGNIGRILHGGDIESAARTTDRLRMEVVEDPEREKTIEEEVGGFSTGPDGAIEAGIAAVEHAPRAYRIDAIKAYRIARAIQQQREEDGGRNVARG
jgi:hypothetical protein